MKRFTERVVNECGSFVMGLCETCPIVNDKGCNCECLQAALTLLADYEDTGLTPKEIERLKCKADCVETTYLPTEDIAQKVCDILNKGLE